MVLISFLSVFIPLTISFAGTGGLTAFYNKVPDFEYNNGILSTDYKTDQLFDDGFKLVVDTDKTIETNEVSNLYNGIYIDREKVIVNNIYSGKMESRKYLHVLPSDFSRDSLKIFIPIIYLVAIFTSGLIFVFEFAFEIVLLFIISFLGWLISRFMKKEQKYFDIFKMCVYASTLPTIVSAIFALINYYSSLYLNLPFLLHSFIVLVYVYSALRTFPSKEQI